MWMQIMKTMKTNNKHKVHESFGEFMGATERVQRPNEVQSAQFGANPYEDIDDDQMELPFEFERSPEIGEEENVGEITLMLEQIQAISDAGVNKARRIEENGQEISPYIKNQLELAYKHLREGYLRLMDAERE